ncbi:carbohydrate ABC transporter permease [Sphingomonas bacterium]|uniref:carbohydrate ABC transporter permease n=1 Tax=Sphingomonas bacterium TaxID=1895847 RepID=UPI001576CB96|nr:carbohydrate ABC transporter permease [Sphingomonas bacterium]
MIRKSTRREILITAVAWLCAFAISFPILWMLLTSFKTEIEAFHTPPRLFGFHLTLENYRSILAGGDYGPAAINSLITATASSIIAIIIGLPAAYAMTFLPGRRTRSTLLWMLSTRMLPPAGVLAPIYFLLRDAHLLDTRLGLTVMLCTAALPLVVCMLFSFFQDVPGEVLEAARLDGASPMAELFFVLIPMTVPGIASTFLLNFVLGWNESFWSLNITSVDAAPLSAFIASFSAPHGLFWAKLSAASVLTIAPVVVVGWLCQRQLVRGLTFGAVK